MIQDITTIMRLISQALEEVPRVSQVVKTYFQDYHKR